MPKLECDVCLSDIARYYDLSLEVVRLNNKLCGMVASSASNANLFGSGRVVVLRDGVRYLSITTSRPLILTPLTISILREAMLAFCLNQISGKQVHLQGSCFSFWLWSTKRRN